MPFPEGPPEASHYTIVKRPREYMKLFDEGKVTIRREISSIDGPRIHFVDGSTEEYDAIILATGYAMGYPFLTDQSLSPGVKFRRLDLYKRVMHPQCPTLCFIAQLDALGNLFSI